MLRKKTSWRVCSPVPIPAPRARSLPPPAPIAVGESSSSPAPWERRSRRRWCSLECLIPGIALSYFEQYPAAGFARACFEFAVFNSDVGHFIPCSHPAAGCLCRRGHSPALGDTAASSGAVSAAPVTPAAAWGQRHLLLLLLHRERCPAALLILLPLNPSHISKAGSAQGSVPRQGCSASSRIFLWQPHGCGRTGGHQQPPGPPAPRAGPASCSITPRGCSGERFHLSSSVAFHPKHHLQTGVPGLPAPTWAGPLQKREPWKC